MAKYTGFPQSTNTLRAPRGMEGVVGDLPIHASYGVAGQIHSTSCWELSAEELSEIALTGRVWLTVIGGHPPARVDGICPIREKK